MTVGELLSPADTRTYYLARLPDARKPAGDELRTKCPIHKGERDSFAVNLNTGLWYCHSSCQRGGSTVDLEMLLSGRDFRAARAAVLEIAGRPTPPAPQGTQRTVRQARQTPRKVVATYVYVDEQGAPLFRVCRTVPKNFYQQRWAGGRWVSGLRNTRRVLYRLPEVLEAPIIFFVEGEKDVETLREQGFVATTTAGGAGSPWLAEYTDALRGREVIVVPDGDGPGWARALFVCRELKGNVARLVVFNDLPEGVRDISDWFAAGHSETELIAILEGADAI